MICQRPQQQLATLLNAPNPLSPPPTPGSRTSNICCPRRFFSSTPSPSSSSVTNTGTVISPSTISTCNNITSTYYSCNNKYLSGTHSLSAATSCPGGDVTDSQIRGNIPHFLSTDNDNVLIQQYYPSPASSPTDTDTSTTAITFQYPTSPTHVSTVHSQRQLSFAGDNHHHHQLHFLHQQHQQHQHQDQLHQHHQQHQQHQHNQEQFNQYKLQTLPEEIHQAPTSMNAKEEKEEPFVSYSCNTHFTCNTNSICNNNNSSNTSNSNSINMCSNKQADDLTYQIDTSADYKPDINSLLDNVNTNSMLPSENLILFERIHNDEKEIHAAIDRNNNTSNCTSFYTPPPSTTTTSTATTKATTATNVTNIDNNHDENSNGITNVFSSLSRIMLPIDYHEQYYNNVNLSSSISSSSSSNDSSNPIFEFLDAELGMSMATDDEDLLKDSDYIDLTNVNYDGLGRIPQIFDTEFFSGELLGLTLACDMPYSPDASDGTYDDDISEKDCKFDLQSLDQNTHIVNSFYGSPAPIDTYQGEHDHPPSPNSDEGFEDGPSATEENLPFYGNFQESKESEAHVAVDAITKKRSPYKRVNSIRPKKKAAIPTPSGERRKPGRKPGQVSNVLHLWEFMRDLLHEPNTNNEIIEWISPSDGVFKVVNSAEVARLWGEKKNNKKAMTYEKLSRSLRYSRLEGYFDNLPKDRNYPKKLCFKFGPKSKDWSLSS